MAELKAKGARLRSIEWYRGSRGLSIDVISSITVTKTGTFQFRIDLADLNIPLDVHFAKVLRSGIYEIRCSDAKIEPQLISYRQTCCPEKSAPDRQR
jgi:hypothetical protein